MDATPATETPLPALSSCSLETVLSSTYMGEANITLGSATIVIPLNRITSSLLRAWKEATKRVEKIIRVNKFLTPRYSINSCGKWGQSPTDFFLALREMLTTIGVGYRLSCQPLKMFLLFLSWFWGIYVWLRHVTLRRWQFSFWSLPHIVQPFLWCHLQIHSDLFLHCMVQRGIQPRCFPPAPKSRHHKEKVKKKNFFWNVS